MNERDLVTEPDKGRERLAIKLGTIISDPQITAEDKSLIRPVVHLAVRRGRLTPEQADKILKPIQVQGEPTPSPIKPPYFELMQQVNGQLVREFFPPN